MRKLSDLPPADPESVWAAMQENDRFIREKFAETAQQLKESRADFDRRMKKMEETMGSWANNQGAFAEDYFFNSFEQGKTNFFGEKFEEIEKGSHGKVGELGFNRS